MKARTDYAAFRVETAGIEYIPRSNRKLTPRGLAGLWAGASFNIEYVVWGALAASFGLSFLQAVVVIVLGNLAWILTGLASLQGPAAGTTAFGVGRAVFGPRPNRLLAGLNWLTQVGFETLGLSLVVLSALALNHEVGGHSGTPMKYLLVIIAAGVQLCLPWFGHATLTVALRACSWLFAASFIVFAVLAAPKIHLHGGWHGASWQTMTIAAVIILSAGGIGWTENANDYSRYLPAGVSSWRVVTAVALGGGVPVLLAEIMGAATISAVANPGSVSIVSGLPGVFPTWFVVPYLLIVIGQLFAINGLNLYSSGVSLQAAGISLPRTLCVLVDTLICASLTIWAVLSSSFTTALNDFAQLIIIWIAPWIGVYLVDAALRRGRYDLRSLFALDAGIYHRRSGTNRQAVTAQLAGMIGAILWINTGPFVGPLSRLAGGIDLSIYVGAGVAAVLYWMTARKMVCSEVAKSETGEPIPSRNEIDVDRRVR